MYVLTAADMKRAEQFAHDERGLTSFSMMGIAGRKCADYIANHEKDRDATVVILCGRGKNAGDGFVIAATLYSYGYHKVFVILTEGKDLDPVSFKMLGEMRKFPVNIINFADYQKTAINTISRADIIIDAIFGIGFMGRLRGNSLNAIVQSNLNRKAKKYAIDIPSGVRCDESDDLPSRGFASCEQTSSEFTGCENPANGVCDDGEEYFHADTTLTMIAYKVCNVLKPNMYKCGKTELVKIGLPHDDVAKFALDYTCLTRQEVKELFGKRKYDANKGDYGRATIVAGNYKMVGCTYLAAQAATEIGAGLIELAVPDCIYPCVAAKLNEPIFEPMKSTEDGHFTAESGKKIVDLSKKASCITMGMGMGVCDDTKEMTKYIIRNAECPLVLDADALNCIADDLDILKEAKSEILITPHPGEMSRLCGKPISVIKSDPIGTAREFSVKYNVDVLLKTPNTVITVPDGRTCLNTTGGPSMSRAGSGDTLCGIITGLVCQGMDLFTAASVGSYVHGGAGDFMAEKYGELSAVPTRVLDKLHEYLGERIFID